MLLMNSSGQEVARLSLNDGNKTVSVSSQSLYSNVLRITTFSVPRICYVTAAVMHHPC